MLPLLSPIFSHPRTEVHFERRAEKRHTSHKEREGLKARDIRLKYPDQNKATTLIDRLTKAGMWYYDPDFPSDREEPGLETVSHFIQFGRTTPIILYLSCLLVCYTTTLGLKMFHLLDLILYRIDVLQQHMYVYAQVIICLCFIFCINMDMCKLVDIYIYTYTYICIYIYIPIYIYICTYIYIYMYIYIYIYIT